MTTSVLPIPIIAGSDPYFTPGASVIAVDGDGYIYIAGSALDNLAATPGAFQAHPPAKDPAVCPNPGRMISCPTPFVAKLDPSGNKVIYLTYLGGDRLDIITGIAVDSHGSVYVAGWTSSVHFPTTEASYRNYSPHSWPAFVVKLNPAGSDIVYGALFGGSGSQGQPVSGLAVDAGGNAYVAGTTNSTDFPITPGAFQSSAPPAVAYWDDRGYIVKVNAEGSGLVYASYIGAQPRAVAADRTGHAYVTGESGGQLVTTPGALQPRRGGAIDAFVLKIDPRGTLLYATYVGGPILERANGVAADDDGCAYITGEMLYNQVNGAVDPQFPVTAGAFQPSFGGSGIPAFVSKVSPDGSSLVYSTYLGGGYVDRGSTIRVNSRKEAIVTGTTYSTDFPVTPDAFLSTLFLNFAGGPYPNWGYVARLDATGARLQYGTYLQTSSMQLAIHTQTDTAYVPLNTVDGRPGLAVIDFHGEPPPLFLSGAGNAANRLGAVVSPGELIALFGIGIGPADAVSATVQNGMIGTSIGGVRVFFDEIAAPVLYAAADRIQVQAPFEIAGRDHVIVTVHYGGAQSNALKLTVFYNVPGIFTVNGAPYAPALILNQDGSVNSPDNPAGRGSIVSLFLTGGGLTTAVGSATGKITPTGAVWNLVVPVGAWIGISEAAVLYAGAAPELISGVAQINIRVPDNAQTGAAVTLSIAMNPGTPTVLARLAVR